MKPTIISSYGEGVNNANLNETISRLDEDARWKDLSTVIIVPVFESIPVRIMASWWNLITPPNQKVVKLIAQGMEVGDAYSRTIEAILDHPELTKFKYILTMEHDNSPPSDGLIKLLMEMEKHKKYSVIGGLYFTKGHGGVAQIWGDPNEHPVNFRPQLPEPKGGLKECNGTGMGFTLFRTSMFKDKKLRRPWFKTTSSATEGVSTQDLYFASDARSKGYKFAIDCSVRVGHYDLASDMMW